MAKVAKKTWPWPGLPGFTRPHFPGKLGQKPGKPGMARLCQAGRVFDRAPDARVCYKWVETRGHMVYNKVNIGWQFGPIYTCMSFET